MQKVERDLLHKSENFQFLKCHHLLKSEQFNRVFNKGKVVRSKYLLIFSLENQLDYPRLGFAISKKSIKSAVKRNRIKRIIKEEFRHQKKLLQGIDIVIVSHNKILELLNHEVREILVTSWKKL